MDGNITKPSTPQGAAGAHATHCEPGSPPQMPIETELLTGPIRGLNTIAWWAVFLLCAVGLSWVFETFKQFTLVPNLTNGLLLAGAFFILLGAFVLLLYDSYAKEKQKDKITRPFALFEAWYHRKR